jgi:hypothetical protein
MNDINNLSKSDSYLKKLDMDRLTKEIESSMDCPSKVAFAIAQLISAKIYLELVCDEEEHLDYLSELEQYLMINNAKETVH